jgi:hypothetical protein
VLLRLADPGGRAVRRPDSPSSGPRWRRQTRPPSPLCLKQSLHASALIRIRSNGPLTGRSLVLGSLGRALSGPAHALNKAYQVPVSLEATPLQIEIERLAARAASSWAYPRRHQARTPPARPEPRSASPDARPRFSGCSPRARPTGKSSQPCSLARRQQAFTSATSSASFKFASELRQLLGSTASPR